MVSINRYDDVRYPVRNATRANPSIVYCIINSSNWCCPCQSILLRAHTVRVHVKNDERLSASRHSGGSAHNRVIFKTTGHRYRNSAEKLSSAMYAESPKLYWNKIVERIM